MRFLIALSAVSMITAQQRSPYLQVVAGDGFLSMSVGEPPIRPILVRFSTMLSEFIVIDNDCGKRVAGCPNYCQDGTLSLLYCSLQCRILNYHSKTVTCSFLNEQYNPSLSINAELDMNRNWTKRMYNMRPLFGRFYRDRIRLDQYWRSAKPRMTAQKILTPTFVSALLFDRKLIYEATAIFGLRPGPDSAALQFLSGLNIARPLISMSMARRFDTIKAYVDTNDKYLTFGAEDRWRCIDWSWTAAPEFVMLPVRVDFMGVEFTNVMVLLDFTYEIYRIPQRVADILVEAQILQPNPVHESPDFLQYKYERSKVNESIRFFDADNNQFLRIGYQTSEKPACLSPVAVDRLDVSSDTRGDQLIFNIGYSFLEQSCLAYDYEAKRVGFGRRRPWSHPLFTNHL